MIISSCFWKNDMRAHFDEGALKSDKKGLLGDVGFCENDLLPFFPDFEGLFKKHTDGFEKTLE